MLGAIGAATLAAHKLWPKGVTYGEKEAWESEKDRAKDKLKDAKAAITGEPRRDGRRRGGDGDGRRRRHHRDGGGAGGGGAGERDRSRERRRRYLEDRGLRDRDARVRDGSDGRRLAPPTAAVAAASAAAAAGGLAASYHHDGRRRGDDHRGAARDRPRDGYDDRDYDRPRGRRDRYLEGGPAPPPPPPAAPPVPPAAAAIPQRRVEQFLPPAAPTPPPVPNPPSVYREAATVVATGARDSERGGRRYYVDSDTVVIPSRAEMEFVVRRDAPPANRLTVERDGRYYR